MNEIIERPVYEFRPLPGYFSGEFRRYADGQWLPDDGEYDIAFIGRGNSFAPICLYVEHGYQKNIAAGWWDNHWSGFDKRHPGGNAWHYALSDGETGWGGDWGRERHLNYKAGQHGMSEMSSEAGCSNGCHVGLTDPCDAHILAGLVRDRATKEIFMFPQRLVCMYCGDEFKRNKAPA